MITAIIFDWKQTLYSPDTDSLIAGANDILQFLSTTSTDLYLVGKGRDDMHNAVESLGVKPYFKGVLFIEGNKQPEHFDTFIVNSDYSKVIVIGDKLSSEIETGNVLGATTIQVKQGKFAADTPANKHQQPDVVVSNLAGLKPVLMKLVVPGA